MSTKSRRVAFGATSAALVLIPLARLPATDGTLVKALIAWTTAGSAAAILTLSNYQPGWLWNQLPSPIRIPLFLHIGWTLISVAAFPYRYAGWQEWLRQAAGWILFLVAISAADEEQHRSRLLQLTVVIGTLCAGHGIRQYVLSDSGWSRTATTGIFSTLGHPNLFASFILVTLLITLNLALAAVKPRRLLWTIAALTQFTALFLSRSKGAFLGLGIALAWLVLVTIPRHRRWQGAVALLLVLVLLSAVGFHHNWHDHFLRQNTFRIRTWQAAIRMLRTAPLTGHGIGRFSIHFPFFRGNDYLRRFRHAENLLHAHCEYLERISEEGMPGLLLWLWVVFAVLHCCVKRQNGTGNHRLFLAAAIIGLLVHNLVSVSLRWYAPYYIFWILAGIGCARNSPAERAADPTERRWYSTGIAIIVLLLVLFIDLTYVRRIRSSSHYFRGIPRIEQPWDRNTLTQLQSAVRLDPYNLPAWYDLGYYYNRNGHPRAALEIYRQLEILSPRYQRLQRNIGLALAVIGRREDAIAAFERELELNKEESTLFMLAGQLERAGKREQALHTNLLFLELVAPFIDGTGPDILPAPPGFRQIQPRESESIRSWSYRAAAAIDRLLPEAGAEVCRSETRNLYYKLQERHPHLLAGAKSSLRVTEPEKGRLRGVVEEGNQAAGKMMMNRNCEMVIDSTSSSP